MFGGMQGLEAVTRISTLTRVTLCREVSSVVRFDFAERSNMLARCPFEQLTHISIFYMGMMSKHAICATSIYTLYISTDTAPTKYAVMVSTFAYSS